MIPNKCIEVQTSPVDRYSVPPWFAEVAILTQHLAQKALLEAFAQQVRLVRGRFGSYESIDFLTLLLGYAISGERTLADFFERVAPFGPAFLALFGRKGLPHRSSLSRFLSDVNRPCLEAFRTLFEQQSFASALRAISTYLKHFALLPEVALVRLDGQYGDAAVIVQLIQAGVTLVTRGRGYRILEHPQLQRALAHPPTASVTRMNTGEIIELFDGGWLPLDDGLPAARVIVARYRAPPASKQIPVGKRIGEWVYELFITTLGEDRFLVEDVLDLYHGRGAFEGVLADEDVEEDPDRWCFYSECGQELWQIACQWVWNLRLCLGQSMQDMQLREIEWAPAKESPPVFQAVEDVPEEYGPWQWAASFGRATGRFGADAFIHAGRMENSAVQREQACG